MSHFLDARCWLDEDGQHVWCQHRCKSGESTTILPWPIWQAVDGQVWPSISCSDCDLHVMGCPIGSPPGDEAVVSGNVRDETGAAL